MITPPSSSLDPPIRWSVHPAREQIGRFVLAVVAIAAFSMLAGLLMNHPAWAVLSALVMAVLLSRFFLPTRYQLDEQGIAACHLLRQQRIPWNEIQVIRVGSEAAILQRGRRRGARDAHILFGVAGHAARDLLRNASKTELQS